VAVARSVQYSLWFVQYCVDNLVKFFTNSQQGLVMYLRKQKFFNKGRYSRNRQMYRTGVYWCIYINIVAVFGLNYCFYKFTVNFLLYWWFFFLLLMCFIYPYFNKYSFYTYYKCFVAFFKYCLIINISTLNAVFLKKRYNKIICDIFDSLKLLNFIYVKYTQIF